MNPYRIAVSVLLLACTLGAQGSVPGATAADPQLPYTPSLDPTAMDRTANPCVDFYQFACGGWMKNNPIPPDQSSWTTYGKMQDDNRALLRALLSAFAPGTTAGKDGVPARSRTSNQQKIGDYYASCMAEPALERRGASPLAPQLDAIAGATSIADLARVVGDSHRSMLVLGPILFGLRGEQDARNSSETIASVDQGGLGLPDRDYYLKDDARSVALRAQYVDHVAGVLTRSTSPRACCSRRRSIRRWTMRPTTATPAPPSATS